MPRPILQARFFETAFIPRRFHCPYECHRYRRRFLVATLSARMRADGHDARGNVGGIMPDITCACRRTALDRDPHTARHRCVLHGPHCPSTRYRTFLLPRANSMLLELISDAPSQVPLVISGHLHRCGYRIVEGTTRRSFRYSFFQRVSPVYRNAPSFLRVEIDGTGSVRAVEEHALLGDGWHDVGGTRSLGLKEVTGSSLAMLQTRLARDMTLRGIFDRLYFSSDPRPDSDVNEQNWRDFWCAATALEITSFCDCLGQGGFDLPLRRASSSSERLSSLRSR
jgi:hypothetical protein